MSPILGARGGLSARAYGLFSLQSTNSYESISTVTVGSGGTATISFSSIPSTYKHLQIRGILKETNSGSFDDPVYVQFNGDTGSNYSYHSVYGNGSGAATLSGVSQTSILSYGTPSNNFTSVWGGTILDILDYANTNKFKTTRWLNGFDSNTTTGSINFSSGNWRSTFAINSITFTPAGGVWSQYTQLALYGVKG